jgi:hypothetical protein
MASEKINWEKVDERTAALQALLKEREFGIPSWWTAIKSIYEDVGNELGVLPALLKAARKELAEEIHREADVGGYLSIGLQGKLARMAEEKEGS